MRQVYDELVDFIAGGTTPQAVVDWTPSDNVRQRVESLIELEKAESISPDEKAELDHYMEIEHVLRLAKAQARVNLGQ